MTVALLLTTTAGVGLGAVAIDPLDVWGIVAHRIFPETFTDGGWTAAHEQIVWGLRLPHQLGLPAAAVVVRMSTRIWLPSFGMSSPDNAARTSAMSKPATTTLLPMVIR